MPSLCRYCFAQVEPGATFCDAECEDRFWLLCPTVDGQVFEPEEKGRP